MPDAAPSAPEEKGCSEKVKDCVAAMKRDHPDYPESRIYAICNAKEDGAAFSATIPLTPELAKEGPSYLTGIATSIDEDRDGERLSLNAARKVASVMSSSPIAVFSSHSRAWTDSVGVVEKAEADTNGTVSVRIRLEPGVNDPDHKAAYLREKIEAGIPLGLSIGGRVLKWGKDKTAGGKDRDVIEDLDLFELSIVGVPSNPKSVGLSLARQIAMCTGPDCLIKSESKLMDNALAALVRKGVLKSKCAEDAKAYALRHKDDVEKEEILLDDQKPAAPAAETITISRDDLEKMINERTKAIAEALKKEMAPVERPAQVPPPAPAMSRDNVEKQIEDFVEDHGFFGLMQKVV